MLTDELLEQLRYKGEGSDLDYKAERYTFAKASDEDKSELLKDILALANTHRDGTAYILIGFKENSPHPADVVGLPAEGAIDDSRLQEFVNGKLETKLDFRYEERLFQGKHIAVISIPKQQRPFYLAKSYGKLAKDTVYVRRGSATAIASLHEVALMGAANVNKGMPRVELILLTPENEPLPNYFDRSFLLFPVDLPDYESDPGPGYTISIRHDNSEFYREGAEYQSAIYRLIHVSLMLANRSDFALTSSKLEVRVETPDGEAAVLMRADHLPVRPHPSSYSYIRNIPSLVERLNERVTIDERGGQPIGHALLGTIRPGEEARCEQDLIILPSGPGVYLLKVRVLANEISPPILVEHALEVKGEMQQMDLDELEAILFKEYMEDEKEGFR